MRETNESSRLDVARRQDDGWKTVGAGQYEELRIHRKVCLMRTSQPPLSHEQLSVINASFKPSLALKH